MVEQSDSNPKLVKIREIMKEHGVDCFVCLHSDAHNSEYLADCDERVAFISGFKGSNGTCVITHDDARMWTDGRYYLAAQKQLQAGWKMEKMEAGVTQWPDWIIENFPAGATVGFDYTQYPAANLAPRKKAFGDKNIQIKQVPNLVDKIWGSDRPARPRKNVSVLDIQFTGQDVLSKFKNVAAKLDGKVDSLLVTTLDDICWVTNLRGADIDYNPVFFAYLVITPKVPVDETQATLYVDVEKVANLKEYL